MFHNDTKSHNVSTPIRELELCVLGGTGEGDDIADVLHAGDEENEALETETETCMGA